MGFQNSPIGTGWGIIIDARAECLRGFREISSAITPA